MQNVVKITTAQRITGTHSYKGKVVDQVEEVRRKRVGSKRRKGGGSTKGKKPTAVSKPILCMLGGGKAPRLSEVHCDRDSVCVKADT